MLDFNHQSVLDKCYRGHVRMFEGLFKAALKKIRHVSGNACIFCLLKVSYVMRAIQV